MKICITPALFTDEIRPRLWAWEGYATPLILLIFPGSVSCTGLMVLRTGHVNSTSPPPPGAIPLLTTWGCSNKHRFSYFQPAPSLNVKAISCLTHLEIEAFSINTKILHQREGCGLQQVDLQEAKRLNPSKIAFFQGFNVKSIWQKTARTSLFVNQWASEHHPLG